MKRLALLFIAAWIVVSFSLWATWTSAQLARNACPGGSSLCQKVPAAPVGPSPTVITFQQVAALGDQSSVTTYNANYTTLTNVNTALVVAFKAFSGNVPTVFTYNSVACDHIGEAANSGSSRVSGFLCYVGGTTPGTYQLHAVSGGANSDAEACVVEYSGVAQTTGFENTTTAQAATASATVSVTTSTANDWGVGLVNNTSGTQSAPVGANGYLWRPIGVLGVTDCYNVYVDTNGAIGAGATTPTLNFSPSIIWGITGFGLKHG